MSESMTLAQACNETRQFGRMLKGLSRLAEVADAFESAEQAVNDRRRLEAEIIAKVENAQAELQRLADSIQGTEESARELIAQANARSVAIGIQAKSDAEAALAVAGAEVDVFKDQVLALRRDLDELAQQKLAAETELGDLNARIAEARATTKRIVEA